MADRTDIDALLISALYGELTPADEARLAAHLESHPADRTALDDMTRTRAAVRESRILAFQAEPPAAVSALLLQEASRRAPRVEPSEGWFQRFVRSFAAHPAMAAAATVVLVLGVAGMLYVRGVDHAAAPAPPAIARHADESAAMPGQPEAEKSAAAPASPAAAPEPQASPTTAPTAPGGAPAVASEGFVGPTGAAAGSAGYRVDLDDNNHGRGPSAAGGDGDLRMKAQPSDEPSDAVGGRRAGFEVGGKADRAELAKAKAEAPAKPAAKQRGIELRRAEPAPKELDERKDSNYDGQLAKERAAVSKFTAQRDAADTERNRAPAADGRAGAPVASQPPPPPAQAVTIDPAPPAQVAAPAPSAPAPDAKRAAKAPGNAPGNASNNAPAANQVARSTPPSPPAAKPATSNIANNSDKAEGKPADTALLAWARKQRDQVVALVTANNCDAAADAAIEIYNRAPGYFSSTILTDREIKPCLVYVNRQRARLERARAAKNANSADTEAPSRK